MNFRNSSIYISDKADFYAHILAKAKMVGTQGEMTKDQLIDAEIIDKWEKEHPELVLAYERNCELRQQNKKAYSENEAEIIKLISPLPGSPK